MRGQIAEYLKDYPVKNLKDFLRVLNFIAPFTGGWAFSNPMSARQVSRFASAKARASAYVDFYIPKKSGGQRKISAPVKELKAIQTAVNLLL